MSVQTDTAIEAVDSALNHVRHFAPDCPLERFLAQEVCEAYARAYETAGWHAAAKVWRGAIEELGEMSFDSQLRLIAKSEDADTPGQHEATNAEASA